MARKKKEPEKEGGWTQIELIPLTHTEIIAKSLEEYKLSADKVRRGIFARHTKLSKRIEELECTIRDLQHQLKVMEKVLNLKTTTAAINVPVERDDMSLNKRHDALRIIPESANYATALHRSQIQGILDSLLK